VGLPLEYVADDDWAAVNRIVNKLRDVSVIDTGAERVAIRFGSGTGSWAGGSPRASNTSVTHGLGRTPVAVYVSLKSAPVSSWFPVLAAFSPTSTAFTVSAVTSDGSSPAAATAYGYYWLAVG